VLREGDENWNAERPERENLLGEAVDGGHLSAGDKAGLETRMTEARSHGAKRKLLPARGRPRKSCIRSRQKRCDSEDDQQAESSSKMRSRGKGIRAPVGGVSVDRSNTLKAPRIINLLVPRGVDLKNRAASGRSLVKGKRKDSRKGPKNRQRRLSSPNGKGGKTTRGSLSRKNTGRG